MKLYNNLIIPKKVLFSFFRIKKCLGIIRFKRIWLAYTLFLIPKLISKIPTGTALVGGNFTRVGISFGICFGIIFGIRTHISQSNSLKSYYSKTLIFLFWAGNSNLGIRIFSLSSNRIIMILLYKMFREICQIS